MTFSHHLFAIWN